MLTSYFKIAFRTLRKQVGFTAINVFGLAVGLTCCLLIALYVLDELSYDRFHEKADRIYRLNSDIRFGGADMHMAVTPDPLGPTLKKDYAQVETFVRIHQRGDWLVKRVGQPTALREAILMADSTLFDVFTLPLVAGNPKRALAEPNTVVISESAARRHFGTQNPLGQSMLFDNAQVYKVTGVMRDMPTNSHFRTDFFLTLLNDDYQFGNWLSNNHQTYIVLKEGTDPATFSKNFATIFDTYVGPQAKQFMNISVDEFRKAGNRFELSMMPLTALHLHSDRTVELAPAGNIQYVYVFSIVAAFILLIACINFMNLATARSAGRAKEVGVRKVLGSERFQLIGQFMTESILLAAVSLVLALGLVGLLLPVFNQIAAKTLTLNQLTSPAFLAALVLIPVGVGLLAGSYPAFFLSSFRPIRVLTGGKITPGRQRGGLRSGLVVFQFAMSVLLIVGTAVVYRQMNYIQTKKLGFDRAQVLTITNTFNLGTKAEAFKSEVLRLPGVTGGTISGYLPTPSWRSDNPFFPEGEMDQSKAVSMQSWEVDYDYVKTLGMQMTQGRNFSREFGADSTGILLNETATKLFGFKNPIGQRVSQYLDAQGKTLKTLTVIGVVKNFHFESLRRNVGALSLVLGRSPGSVSFRLSGADYPALIQQIEAKWQQVAPGQPFSYQFLDESFDAMYRAEQRIGTLALLFAGLAILIACLGLFGLSAFTAEQRTKEIGVRKVLGASVFSIVGLLSKDFLKLVFIAIVLASPLAWWAMNRWLADFAYKIDIEWWVFALAGLLAVGIALLTVSFQSVKAALMNPVKSLRSE